MKTAPVAIFLMGVILLTPMALHAQRFGFSVGAPASQSTTGTVPNRAATPAAPQMPPLPSQPPMASKPALPSLQLTLKPLNLMSLHLAPPQFNLAPDLRRLTLPALPFALDPIAARSLPQMCTDTTTDGQLRR